MTIVTLSACILAKPPTVRSAFPPKVLIGVAWRLNDRDALPAARREAVGLPDRHVGPKY